jgi:hypothetical protein
VEERLTTLNRRDNTAGNPTFTGRDSLVPWLALRVLASLELGQAAAASARAMPTVAFTVVLDLIGDLCVIVHLHRHRLWCAHSRSAAQVFAVISRDLMPEKLAASRTMG